MSIQQPDGRTQAELLNILRHGTPQKQRRALVRLSAVGEAEALDAVVEYMRNQPPGSAVVGLNALRVLASKYMPIERYGLAEVLIPFLQTANWNHRLAATRLLSTHPNELAIDALRDLIDEALEQTSSAGRPHLSSVRYLAERALAEAIMALASCGRLLVLPEILEFLDDPSLRHVATRALGMINSDTERPRLEELCEDDDVHVRDAAQWALGLMDERAEMFTKPPDQLPEPPPDRLHPIYWAHRQLRVSGDELLQFLIVRVAIEHLLLDSLLSAGGIPESCLIIVRSYEGDTPPSYRSNEAKVMGAWAYYWNGPALRELEEVPRLPTLSEMRRQRGLPEYGAAITISYPNILPSEEKGLVSFDCLFGQFLSRGWIYHVALMDGEWTFSLIRRTWSG